MRRRPDMLTLLALLAPVPLIGACEIETTEIDLVTTAGIRLNPGWIVVNDRFRAGEVPSLDVTEWPDDLVITASSNDPIVVNSSLAEIDITESEVGGAEALEQRVDIRKARPEGLFYSVLENSIEPGELGCLELLGGEENSTAETMARLTRFDACAPPHTFPVSESFTELEPSDELTDALSSLLYHDKFKVGLRTEWHGTLSRATGRPSSAIEVLLRLESVLTVNDP